MDILSRLRQSFLDGSLTRLPDPDFILRSKIIEFVEKGSFGLASGKNPDGTYMRVWFKEHLPTEEVDFKPDVYLLTKEKAKKPTHPEAEVKEPEVPEPVPTPEAPERPGEIPTGQLQVRTLTIRGSIPPELWNRLGTKIIPKLKQGSMLHLGLEFTATVDGKLADGLRKDIEEIISDLKLTDALRTSLD
ncbi:MAG: hypothetical protein Kow0099_39280 [Candidatus Abyssubacteria bacterium]